MMAGSMAYISAKTPKSKGGLTVMATALFNGFFVGLGGVVGNIAGGVLMDDVGAQTMFLIKTAITAIAGVIFVAAEYRGLCGGRAAR